MNVRALDRPPVLALLAFERLWISSVAFAEQEQAAADQDEVASRDVRAIHGEQRCPAAA